MHCCVKQMLLSMLSNTIKCFVLQLRAVPVPVFPHPQRPVKSMANSQVLHHRGSASNQRTLGHRQIDGKIMGVHGLEKMDVTNP